MEKHKSFEYSKEKQEMTFEYNKEKNWPHARVEHRFTIMVPFSQDDEQREESGRQVSAMLDVWQALNKGQITPKELRDKL